MGEADLKERPGPAENRQPIPKGAGHDEFLVLAEEGAGQPVTGRVVREFYFTGAVE